MEEKRKFLRFPISLDIEVDEEGKVYSGKAKDVSRSGMRCFFEEFDYSPQTMVNFKIQRPYKDIFVPFKGEVIWKRKAHLGWEIGIRIKEIPLSLKSEILELGYRIWLEDKGVR